jgi:hypothetical protein
MDQFGCPPAPQPIANLDLVAHHATDLFNKKIPDTDQLLVHRNRGTSNNIGHDLYLFGRLASLLVGSEISRRLDASRLDYRAFSMNNTPVIQSRLSRRGIPEKEDEPEFLQECVERWCKSGVDEFFKRPKDTLFRRSLIIAFETEFEKYESLHFAGHQITIAFEVVKSTFRLFIIEYRMHEYVYNVHGRLFQYMANAVRSSEHFQEAVHLITESVVCLKGRLHVDSEFMLCMSVSYRVSVMLACVSSPEDIRETPEEFEASRRFLMHHTFTMLNWFLHCPDVAEKRTTVLICEEMTQDFFELHKGLHFVMVPFEHPDRSQPGIRRLVYDLGTGQFVSQGGR